MERNGREPPSGFLEWFGYHERAQGWLFVGSIPESCSQFGDDPQVVARGLYGEMRDSGVIALFPSPTSPSIYIGFAAFVAGEGGFLNELGTLLLGDGESFVEAAVPYPATRRSVAQMDAFLVDLYSGGTVTEFGKSLLSIIPPSDLDAHSGEYDEPQAPYGNLEEGQHFYDADAESAARQALPHRAFVNPSAATATAPGGIVGSLDVVFASRSGAVFFVGWADDRFAPIHTVAVEFDDGRSIEIAGSRLMRLRRQDAENAIEMAGSYHLGYCGLAIDDGSDNGIRRRATLIRFSTADGEAAVYPIEPQMKNAGELRDVMLGYLANAGFFGNGRAESFYALDGHLGDALIRYNLETIKPIVKAAGIERFGAGARRYKGSIVVCLYGKPEFQFLQNALFSAGPGAADFEYIYVSNSPELIEAMCNSSLISQRVYGLDVTLVMLPGNAGFGAANNVAARYARSDRLMIVNPDVFPMRQDWAGRHEALIAGLPKHQSRLFGPRLFYSDGSLMHAGMYFDLDNALSVSGLEIHRRPMLRVEHYGKGAPGSAAEFIGSRAVSAVSGAFISIHRDWFENLGGFSEEYIFGHYEDADLCLRSLDNGVAAWVHDLDFWHLEGKGSTRLPHHEGASAVNRWLFTRRWHDRVVPELLGRVSPSPNRIN